MLARFLRIGLQPSLDFEETIKVKLLNVVSLLFILILYFYIIYHTFFTKKYEVVLVQFIASLSIPLIFYLQHKYKYAAAKLVFFVFLHAIIFVPSLFLLPGQGVENFFIVVTILLLILVNNTLWYYFLIPLNVFLYISPQLFIHPYPNSNYSFVTALVVYFSVILSVRFFILIQDQYKKQLKVQKERLEKLNDEKSDLIGIVAHDLKVPLSQIKNFISVLELGKDQLNQEQKQLIKKIKRVTDNQSIKITRFLDAKSFENSFEQVKLKKVSVKKVVETAVDEMLAQAVTKRIRLNYIGFAHKNLHIKGSEEWLLKVVSNLISNAIKFSNSGTEIITEIKLDNDHVIVSVKDEGQGFNKEDMQLIFRKNKLLSATPTANEGSSGMGLYIVKKYVDLMNGLVWVNSKKGKGATFFVKIPRYVGASITS